MADFNHAYLGELVTEAQAGSSDAFAELYAITYNHIYNYAVHYMRNTDLAQDVVQETYICALKNIRSIKDSSLFVAWLNQICFRTCYDMTRKAKVDSGQVDSELLELVRDEYLGHNPEQQAELSGDITYINEAIESLPLNEQQVIIMRYYNDMKLEEIASAMNISRSSVKRYLASAKERLTDTLRKGGF